ncbi:hypothetical protein ACOMHN_034681 [Nucella lapillus]
MGIPTVAVDGAYCWAPSPRAPQSLSLGPRLSKHCPQLSDHTESWPLETGITPPQTVMWMWNHTATDCDVEPHPDQTHTATDCDVDVEQHPDQTHTATDCDVEPHRHTL